MKNNSFIPLYVTNFFGTLNDNFLKTLASFTVIGWLSDERVKSLAMGVTAGALVLPYILCSPLRHEVALARHRRDTPNGASKLALLAREVRACQGHWRRGENLDRHGRHGGRLVSRCLDGNGCGRGRGR